MNIQIDALKARFLVVSVLFLASACVIQSAAEQPKGEEAVQTAQAAPAPEKGETAVAKAPAQKPAPAAKPATVAKPQPKVAAAKPAKSGKSAPALASAPAPVSATASVKFNRVSRYVTVENLNVRSRAHQNAPIVGRLARGSMITVSVDGDWAKIGDTQFVAVRHLSKQQPQTKRLVSRK